MAEINIVNMSRVLHDSNSRIESEFYQHEYAETKKILIGLPHVLLHKLLEQPVRTGHTPSMKNKSYYGNEVAFVKTDNLHNNIINETFKDYLSSKGNALIKGSELRQGDILTTIIGATFDVVPRSSLVPSSILPANINQNIALIRVAPQKAVPEFISIYLNSKYGKTYLRYLSRQTGQVNLNCREVEQVIVPLFSTRFQNLIGDTVKQAYKFQDDSKSCYNDAEKYLLKATGLSDFVPSDSKFSIRTLSGSFRSSNRIDAEYYQQKYDDIFMRLQDLPCNKLGKIVTIKKSIEPGSDYYGEKGIPFVRVSDLTKHGISYPDIKVPAHLTELRPIKDTILLTKDGSVGIAYKVEEDIDYITSSALLHLTIKQKRVLPDYLTLVLNSIIVQSQAERDAGGSIIQHWKPSEIGDVIIPILDDDTQKKITTDVQSSFSLRRQSEQLLNFAKQAVEMAIEEGEDIAMKWLGVFTKGKSGGPKA